MTTTFRAAYWIAADGQSDVLLTDEAMSSLPETDLIEAARIMAAQIDLDITDGSIVVGEYTTR